MPVHQKKQSQNHGLGKALMNHRAKTKKLEYERELHTTEIYDNKPISVTQENDLENFLNTAALAGVDFTAVRQNVVIINSSDRPRPEDAPNPFLLSAEDQAKVEASHRAHKDLLRVPRRPNWNDSTTSAQLDRLEREGFLEWRKGLADLTDNRSLLLTPFERNIEVWRQLWRVLERSQLIVQIVDARNPLRFRCEDLEKYVDELSNQALEALEIEPSSRTTGVAKLKTNLLLVNKSDLLTEKQRVQWAEYFDSHKIPYAFFSAADAVALQSLQNSEQDDPEDNAEAWEETQDDRDLESRVTSDPSRTDFSIQATSQGLNMAGEPRNHQEESNIDFEATASVPSRQSVSAKLKTDDDLSFDCMKVEPKPKTRILTVGELEELFISHAKIHLMDRSTTASASEPRADDSQLRKLVVGLVGYPNVGKSSTINALVGSKKVSVSATPGKTKHFQTIHLSPDVILCDCPGLVFPQFASTKAELVCDGVLPIDQMREHSGPISLITQRIPKPILEATYGLQLQTLPIEEGGDGVLTASEFLTAYAIARGAFTGGGGMSRPDESKVARPILKDYVAAKLLYCQPPPLLDLTPDEFNAESREIRLKNGLQKKLGPTNRVPQNSDTFVKPVVGTTPSSRQSSRSQALDLKFSNEYRSNGNSVSVGIKGRRSLLSSDRKVDLARLRLDGGRGLGPVDDHGNPIQSQNASLTSKASSSDKKHFKRTTPLSKNKKSRSGKGYDDI